MVIPHWLWTDKVVDAKFNAIVGYFFPFVGLLIVVFLAPAVVNSWGSGGYVAETSVGDRGAPRDQPMTALRPY